MKIGFIGLGLMGLPMAKNILKAGFSLVVYNRTKSKTEELEKMGAVVANTPAELAKEVDVVITMVTAHEDVRDILFSQNGVVKGAQKGLIVVDMSTIGPTEAKDIGNKLIAHGIEFVDAPVTGSTPGAINGTLTIFIGGKQDVYEKLKSLFQAMGKNLQYIGPMGSGQAIKLINNHLIAASIVALAEGMLLSDAMGLPRQKVGEVLQTVPAMSGFMNLKLPNYVNNEYPLLFSSANMKKDLSLALKEALRVEKNLPMLIQVEGLYKKLLDADLGDKDMSVVIKVLEDNS